MARTNFDQLLEAGCHFGHLTRKWNPAMAPYIFMERNGIHIIDLNKTVVKIDEAADFLRRIVAGNGKVLFVGTKKQAKEVVAARAQEVGMPYIAERWAGGTLTNFSTVKTTIKKMEQIDKMSSDGTYDHISKREKLQIKRQREKLEKNLGSIANMNTTPKVLVIVDIQKEAIAVREAHRLNIPVIAIVDTNSNPNDVEFAIPANDDATKSVDVILEALCGAIKEGQEDYRIRKADQEAARAQEKAAAAAEGAEAPKKRKQGERRQRINRAEEAPAAEPVAAEEEAPKAEE